MPGEYDAAMVNALAVSHRRDLRQWSSIVSRAQVLPREEKESVLRALAQHDLGAAARFARHAGVGGAAVDALLQRAMRELDASSIAWVIEDVLGALGERRFLAAMRRVSVDASEPNIKKASYWARGGLSEDGRAELDRIVAERP
jgi:hypothetical protein